MILLKGLFSTIFSRSWQFFNSQVSTAKSLNPCSGYNSDPLSFSGGKLEGGGELISTINHDPHERSQLRAEVFPGFWDYCQRGK
jgi:hypothetical protein